MSCSRTMRHGPGVEPPGSLGWARKLATDLHAHAARGELAQIEA
jgi:hypothetical protein